MLPPAPTHPDLVAAAQRLRGHLVCCPVIGDLCLPGLTVPPDLRLKAELLQPGGSLWFRGAQHWLLRQLGRCKGLACAGDGTMVAAFARAAHAHRLPMVALLPQVPTDALRGALEAAECAVRVGVADARQLLTRGPFAGFSPAPAADEPDFVLGVATVVQELAEELPAGTERLLVAPAALAPAVALGVTMLRLAWQVEAAPRDHPQGADVARALREQHRLCTEGEGAAAVALALARGLGDTCVLLGV